MRQYINLRCISQDDALSLLAHLSGLDMNPKIGTFIIYWIIGAMSEWLKEAVLKTVVPQGTGGSNPPCSVSGIVLPTKSPLLRKWYCFADKIPLAPFDIMVFWRYYGFSTALARASLLERCESGRIGLPAKELCPERVPGVRIPPAPKLRL